MRLDEKELRGAVERWVDSKYGRCTLAGGYYDMDEEADRRELVRAVEEDVRGVCGLLGEVRNDEGE